MDEGVLGQAWQELQDAWGHPLDVRGAWNQILRLMLQEIFEGTTERPLPELADHIKDDRIQLAYTASKWQASESFADFVKFMDGHFNGFGEEKPRILLMDMASTHTARMKLETLYLGKSSLRSSQPLP